MTEYRWLFEKRWQALQAAKLLAHSAAGTHITDGDETTQGRWVLHAEFLSATEITEAGDKLAKHFGWDEHL